MKVIGAGDGTREVRDMIGESEERGEGIWPLLLRFAKGDEGKREWRASIVATNVCLSGDPMVLSQITISYRTTCYDPKDATSTTLMATLVATQKPNFLVVQ
ncbi:hypothetical protein HAX54_022837 [Datura stramonium]|uniref:Uncharacterized protein n=1 Tax=Datura stramonium TaxID=4076 RepID=A0ABS8UVA9_DATST|nr:hypothetical protein [Datura stramonium]